MSHRYITDRFLPARRLTSWTRPPRASRWSWIPSDELASFDRQILQLEIERMSLSKEKDAASKNGSSY